MAPDGGRSLHHFRSPYLHADEVAARSGLGEVVLRQGDRELNLEISGDIDSATRVLRQLRDPTSEVWSEVGRNATDGLFQLVDKLDRLGWLLEADYSGEACLSERVRGLNQLCDDAVAWLRDAWAWAADNGQHRRGALAAAVTATADLATSLWEARREGSLLTTSWSGGSGEDSLSRDISARALRLSLIAWQRTSPLAVQVLSRSLRQLLDGGSRNADDAPDAWDPVGLAIADVGEVRKQVWGAVELVAMSSTTAWAARFPRHVPDQPISGPGVNVLVAGENCAEGLLLEIGTSPLFGQMSSLDGATRAARCIYQHQHFVTIRYIEAILSFLRYRLHEPVRSVGFRYLSEEQGHEVHELAACLELGLSEQDVREFAPFPLFMSYPEVLGLLAEGDPLSFCLAVTVAEGLPGTDKPLARALAASGVRADSLASHSDIDIVLDHAQFTRRLLSEVPWVTPAAAARAIANLLFVVELSQLAWVQIARYSQRSDLAVTPRAFSLSAADLFAIWGDA